MALVSRFEKRHLERLSLHDPVEAQLFTYEIGGKKLLQINTVGRSTRDLPGKVSQSLQLDEHSASELFQELKIHFGFQ